MELIRANHIAFGYSEAPVLADVTLSIRRGEIVSLLGPNGSGKTTLIKVILGIYRPRCGEVYFEGKSLAEIPPKELAKKIAYVPQFHRMAFAYSVLDIVLMGRMPHKPFFFRYSRQDRNAAVGALDRLSISHLKDKRYTEISGGERQLVLISRALAQGADTLIMDEPANSLDFGNQIRLLDEIRSLAQDGYTFVKSTHFPDHALWIADRVIMIRKGAVVADGRPTDIINDESICSLYNTRVTVLDIGDRMKTCLPRSIFRPKDLQSKSIQENNMKSGESNDFVA